MSNHDDVRKFLEEHDVAVRTKEIIAGIAARKGTDIATKTADVARLMRILSLMAGQLKSCGSYSAMYDIAIQAVISDLIADLQVSVDDVAMFVGPMAADTDDFIDQFYGSQK